MDIPRGPSESVPLRASDAEREKAAALLREAAAEGRIDLGEVRSGRWRPGKSSRALALVGDCTLDLRQAEVGGMALSGSAAPEEEGGS